MRLKNVPKTPKPTAPAFFDKVIGEIQDGLVLKLSWLDHAFGISQRLVETKDRKASHYPGVYISKRKYISVFPSQDLGNFSFFRIEDPQEIDFSARAFNKVRAVYSLIFWVNLEKVMEETTDRSKEGLKKEILQALTRGLFLQSGSLTVAKIYEEAENIYKDYDIKEIDSQFLTQPYWGVRFEGELTLSETC